MRGSRKQKILVLSLVAIGIMLLLENKQSGKQVEPPLFHQANEAYLNGKFQSALDGFYQVIKQDPQTLRQNPLLTFKLGYSLYRTGRFNSSFEVFNHSNKVKEIADYYAYFQILNQLELRDTSSANHRMDGFRQDYPESALLTLLDSLQATIAIKQNLPDSALKYYKRMLNAGRFEKTEIYLTILRILNSQKDIAAYRKYAHRFLRIYPFHNRADYIYEQLLDSYEEKIGNSNFKKLIRYLFTKKQFLTAEKLIAYQKKFITGATNKDYLNWLPVEISYQQGEYSRVLDWCLEQRQYYKSFKILREIDLHIARCYLRIGQVDKSIQAYLEFQKRYPGDRLSSEVLWKVAWLYEQQKDISNAIKTYRKLVARYKNSKFREEAYFRIGLDYYRLKKYETARESWEEALQSVRSKSQHSRILYWIGKCYEKEQNYQQLGEIYIELAKRPIDSFYNLKAFYLTSNGENVHRTVKKIFWQIHHKNYSFLPRYLDDFQRPILIKEILGSEWSNYEIENLEVERDNWKKRFALGELYERMKNYGKAYRVFRSIFNTHFYDANLPDMVAVFKKLYPFYFSNHVDTLGNKYAVPPALILSVIKKESAFEPHIISYANAHGLMQLLPGTASQLAPLLKMRFTSTKQLFDPEINSKMGTYYLSRLLNRFHGNYIMALAAYNAGPHRVERWKENYSTEDDDLFMENLEFEQTRVYVRTCMKYFWVYRAIINPAQIPEDIVHYPVKFTDFL